MDKKPRHLYLVSEENTVLEGPITRLGLWNRFEPLSKKQFTFFLVSKLMLLGVLLYFAYSI